MDRILKLLPWRWPFTGIPGSRQESDSSVTPGGKTSAKYWKSLQTRKYNQTCKTKHSVLISETNPKKDESKENKGVVIPSKHVTAKITSQRRMTYFSTHSKDFSDMDVYNSIF